LHLINDPALFPDDMSAHWDPRAIASTLRNTYLTPDNTLDLDVLITFDQHGVSAHRNHVSLYHGAVEFLRGLLADATAGTDEDVEAAGAGALPRLYTLTTTGIFRKYIALLDIIPTRYFARKELKASEAKEKKLALLKEHLQKKGQPVQVESHDPGILRPGDRFVFQNNILGYRRARAAMTRAYESQMVWFRHGWILLGRYMYVNDLKRVDVTRST
ncbi:N-acetylglucosaminyl-phosphatidylinositol de-N-acetylase, partial [Ascosphaera atra]